MSSRIFTRLRQLYRSSSSQAKSGNGSETPQWGGHAVKFVKYVCIVHVVREYVCEFSLVRPDNLGMHLSTVVSRTA